MAPQLMDTKALADRGERRGKREPAGGHRAQHAKQVRPCLVQALLSLHQVPG